MEITNYERDRVTRVTLNLNESLLEEPGRVTIYDTNVDALAEIDLNRGWELEVIPVIHNYRIVRGGKLYRCIRLHSVVTWKADHPGWEVVG